MILLKKIARPFGKTALNRSIHLDLQPRQLLNSRYEIIDRLGQGQHSTVWLAHDKTRHSSQLAIKVLKNTTTALQGTDAYELEVLQTVAKLADRFPDQAGGSHVLHLLDHFRVKGEDSDHLCLVTKVLGPHLLFVQRSFEGSRVPLPLVRHVTRQILEALAFLHDTCNIVHTDIKQDNIMFDVYGSSAPNFLTANVILGDFDTAMPPRGDHRRLIQPLALRSPEVIAGCEWGLKSDIWNMGCIVSELLSGSPLFKPKPLERDGGGVISPAQVHFAHIYSHVWADNEDGGRLLIFFADGSYFFDLFDNELLKLKFGMDSYQSLQEVLNVYNIFTPELHDFLMSMLRIHPDDRLCARELLKHPWLCI